MKNHLVIYTNKKFRERGESIEAKFNGSKFDSVIHYKEEGLSADFLNKNKTILSQERGAGYWLWKPYILLDLSTKYKDSGDIFTYVDAGDEISAEFPSAANAEMEESDLCLTSGCFAQRDWTKRDCFKYMNCDNSNYWNAIQIEAGIIVFKATDFTKKIFKEWLEFCEDERILTDIPNTCGVANFSGFKDHRHDQSVLTNLKVKYNLRESSFVRAHSKCNVWSV